MIIEKSKIKVKLLFRLFIFCICSTQAKAQTDSTFTIKGKINGLVNEQWVRFQNIENEVVIIDSAKTVNGEFIFTGNVPKPMVFKVSIGNSTKEAYNFFVENTQIDLVCDYKSPFGCEVKGSYNQHLIDEFAIRERIAWNPEVIAKLQSQLPDYDKKAGFYRKQKFTEAIKTFALLHPNDRSIAYLVSLNSNYILDEELGNIYEKFGESLKNSTFAKEIKADVDMRNATKIGKQMYNFQQSDLNGEPIMMEKFTGKYVLLYFWASGFAPCRNENYALKKVYEKYRKSDFEIVAVSLDSTETDWHRAVLEDNLTWVNVSDLKGWDNEIAKKLSIQAVPFSILIDRVGEIIGRDMRTQELDNVLNLITSTIAAKKATVITQEKTKEPFYKKWLPKKTKKGNGGLLPGAKQL